MRSICLQDTWARSIRKACSLKCFRERLIVMRGRPSTHAGNEAVIAEILVEDSRGVFRGQVGPGRFLDDLCEIEGI